MSFFDSEPEVEASFKRFRSTGDPDYAFLGDDEYFVFETIEDAQKIIEEYLAYELFLKSILIVEQLTEEVVIRIDCFKNKD